MVNKRLLVFVGLILLVVLGALSTAGEQYVPGAPLKVGFIYVGPVTDYGWTAAHDQARQICVDTFPWLETVIVETVEEGGEASVIDRLVRDEGCQVILTCSFGFIWGTQEAAVRYPDTIFFHCSGFLREPNMATYMADFYQIYYLNGLIAGALTETNKLGYIGAVPIPEVKRHIGAFALGVRAVNPDAEVHVRWINAWVDEVAAAAATQALIAEGCDGFAFTEDTATVVQVAADNDFFSFGHYSPMYVFSPEYCVSGQIAHWEAIYLDFIEKVYEGEYTARNLKNVDYWWLLQEGGVEAGCDPGMVINPAWEDDLKAVTINDPVMGTISVYDLVMTRLQQMSDPGITFDPFQGPVYDRTGTLRVPAGCILSFDELTTMQWAVDGIVGPWPDEP
ncbi:MAG: BMP family ABC transporter substrate-binding protein [Candidatus Atribacteria bacterium]|nr:MAG: BMP family ABC transporter substrate-binding protein [Candidatus Atribacteria bacterium]